MKICIVNGFALQTFAVYDFTYTLCTFIQNGCFFVTAEVKCCFLLKSLKKNIFLFLKKRNQYIFDITNVNTEQNSYNDLNTCF